MRGNSLEFKGRREGLFAVVRGFRDFESFLKAMENKLSSAGNFFNGACLSGVYGIPLDETQEGILRKVLEDKYQIRIGSPLTRKRNLDGTEKQQDGAARFVKRTLRSGQKLSYEGSVVIMGDVNAGAEIEAGGNIVVMGTLRGIARAGVPDNQQAFITALSLHPTQLVIGGIAARWPEGQQAADGPETAFIEGGRMYIQPIFHKK